MRRWAPLGGVHTGGGRAGIFHAVVRGSGWIEVDGATAQFRTGDLLVMPHGHAHVLRDTPQSPVRHISEWPTEPGPDGLPTLLAGHDGAPTSLLCGTFALDAEARDFLLPLLPPLIHVSPGPSSTAGWLDTTLRLMADELDAQRPGSAALVARLADLLFIHVLRAWIEQAPEGTTGWLGALSDSQLGRAIGQIHGDAARSWTVGELAREAGMSRSAFFARFSDRGRGGSGGLPHPLADVPRALRAPPRNRRHRRSGQPRRVRLRGSLQPSLQAPGRGQPVELAEDSPGGLIDRRPGRDPELLACPERSRGEPACDDTRGRNEGVRAEGASKGQGS